jgi:hypothetical protein
MSVVAKASQQYHFLSILLWLDRPSNGSCQYSGSGTFDAKPDHKNELIWAGQYYLAWDDVQINVRGEACLALYP